MASRQVKGRPPPSQMSRGALRALSKHRTECLSLRFRAFSHRTECFSRRGHRAERLSWHACIARSAQRRNGVTQDARRGAPPEQPASPASGILTVERFSTFRSQREVGPGTAPSNGEPRSRALQSPQGQIGRISHLKMTKLKIFNTFNGCEAVDTRPHCRYQPPLAVAAASDPGTLPLHPPATC